MTLADISGIKDKTYLNAKIQELETNSKIKNIRDLYRGISDFKKVYRPRSNTVNAGKGDLLTGSYSILARWRSNFSQLLDADGENNVGQTEIRTAEPLVPEWSAFEVELAIGKLKSHKSPCINQILAERSGGRTIRSEIRKHNYFLMFIGPCIILIVE